jgi:hypothetical protein
MKTTVGRELCEAYFKKFSQLSTSEKYYAKHLQRKAINNKILYDKVILSSHNAYKFEISQKLTDSTVNAFNISKS